MGQPEGYIEPVIASGSTAISSFNYVYQYADHLGNIRLSYSDKNNDGNITQEEIIEENNYYPFGLQQKRPNIPVNGRSHAYRYNNTELEEGLGLHWYEMPLRSFDPTIARWNRQDPVVHHGLSTYNAFDNNPIYYADPSGGNSEAESPWNRDNRENTLDSGGRGSFGFSSVVGSTGGARYNSYTGQYEDRLGRAVSFGDALASRGISIDTNKDRGLSGVAMLQNALNTLGDGYTVSACCDKNPYDFPDFGGETAVLDEIIVKAVNKKKFPSAFEWNGNPRLDYALAVAYRDKWNNHFKGFALNYNAGWESWQPGDLGYDVMQFTSYSIGGTLGGVAGGSIIGSYVTYGGVGSAVSNGYASYQAYSTYAYTYVNAYGNPFIRSFMASAGSFYFSNTPKSVRRLLFNKHVYRTLMNPQRFKDIDLSKHLFFKGPKVFNKLIRGGAGTFE
ncbi:RHS repeat-associated core domain-containing protein [Aquimarina sp. 2304DJ70-9]|uniref:RHS repeat-associated core domain-containing protein n=1 Tax=Aquimarina penaris TaxID=3231044 RepID=UPI003462982E